VSAATQAERFCSSDLDLISVPEGWRVEVIDRELHVAKQPSWDHQATSLRVATVLLE
jgi:hypothetical protein